MDGIRDSGLGISDKAQSDNNEKLLPESPKPNPQSTESGGPKGPEPTRYGDWEIGGKCVDF